MYRQARDKSGNIIKNVIVRTSDGAFIPADNANKDWLDYQEWLKAGNIPLPPE